MRDGKASIVPELRLGLIVLAVRLVDREDAVVLAEHNCWLFARFEHRPGEVGQEM
jgi:hypothetical protein